MRANLQWARGVGYYPPQTQFHYGREYYDRYADLGKTPMGHAIVAFRVGFVDTFCPGRPVLDVGCGSGEFVRARPNTTGFDVIAEAVQWLKATGRYRDPAAEPTAVLTFWDSLEHLPDPQAVLRQATRWVFVSLPIFASRAHALRSKHFKPNEHLWYFTHRGLVAFFGTAGFALEAWSRAETHLGREAIESFAFRRHAH